MTDLASREFLTEFIELYRSFPCLWQIKCKEYSDRQKKDLAYAELVDKYREVEPTADRNAVVKKINSLRTVYKKEVAKVANSVKSGAEDIYKPKLWYFPLLNFLSDQDTSRKGKNTIDDDEDVYLKEAILEDNEQTQSKREASRFTFNNPKRLKTSPDEHKSKVVCSPTDVSECVREDDCDIVGKLVAAKLRKMDDLQRIYAEKLINDVLYKGVLDQLNETNYIGDSNS